MARLGVIIIPSSNDATRRVRCGVAEQTIERDERTIYVATARYGRECKPEALLRAVVRAIRRGELDRDWEPVDVTAILGLEVQLIKVENKSLVMLGGKEIYLENKGNTTSCNWLSPASEVAEAIAAALHTTVKVINAEAFPVPSREDTHE